MKTSKKIILFILTILILIFLLFFFIKIRTKSSENMVSNVNNDNDVTEKETLQDIITEEIENMTLREKIGQMIILGYDSSTYDDNLDELLSSVKPGGFILFSYNLSDYDGTVEYINKISQTADIPLIISVDQEGGRVQRIKDIEGVSVTQIPDMYTLGSTLDSVLAYNVGKVIGEELSAFGINMDFAPVLDIYSNPENTVIGNRSFGSDSDTVISMALPLAQGILDSNVMPVYKHFPGHGDTSVDSHIELPIVTKTKEELYESELLPFVAAIKNNAQAIMVGHIALPNVTGTNIPASLSYDIVTSLLREEMGFDGVVITDALNMGALTQNYSSEEIYTYAIEAGVDILLMPTDSEDAVNIIESLVQNGTISESRIDESVRRILTLKHNNGLYEESELLQENIGSQEHIDIINEIYSHKE